MAHWDEERDKRRVAEMRACGLFAWKHHEVIDKYEETGDPTY